MTTPTGEPKVQVVVFIPKNIYDDLHSIKGTKRSWYDFLIGENLEKSEVKGSVCNEETKSSI